MTGLWRGGGAAGRSYRAEAGDPGVSGVQVVAWSDSHRLTNGSNWSSLKTTVDDDRAQADRKIQEMADEAQRERARALIASRLDRLAFGNPGDVKPVGHGISELRIDYGLGYRVYFQKRGSTIIVLLCGGDKRTQDRDIKTAKRLAAEWSEANG
jgi:putative addiction module killer protein